MDIKDFLNYIIPIITGSSGFIRTVGYVTHIPGYLIFMDEEETFISYTNIPIIYDIRFTANINTISKMKDYLGDFNSFMKDIYFIGFNIKQDHSINYFNKYCEIDLNSNCVYFEENCYNLNGFEQMVSNTDINSITIYNGSEFYIVPISKSILPLNKGDTCSLYIFNNIYERHRTIRYSVYKKKYKLYINIFTNILLMS